MIGVAAPVQPRVDGTLAGLHAQRVAGGEHVLDGLGVIRNVVRRVVAYHGELLGALGQPLERGAKGHAGDGGFNFTGKTARRLGRLHVGVKCLKLARAAAAEEQHNRLVTHVIVTPIFRPPPAKTSVPRLGQ